jgi:U3 small nucleolar RNA-associated protein 14
MKILNNVNRILEQANKSLGDGNELSKELLKLMSMANKNDEEINEEDLENATIGNLKDVENGDEILLEDIQENISSDQNIEKNTVNKKVQNKKQAKKSHRKGILDFSKDSIVNGIVFNEILAKPKGLRRR